MCNDAKGTFKLYTFSSQNFHENLYKLNGDLVHDLGRDLEVDGYKNIQFNCTLGVITH